MQVRKQQSELDMEQQTGSKLGKEYIKAINYHTAYWYCSHEIKRYLILGRKALTNLDSMLKSRDVTLPTNVRLVKAMVFLVVMYGCEIWTIKKAGN